ncbi:hypothetical protein Tco_1120874 [Tanacetum coccineum]|uniref:Uncharacterized protein n=1 Tax=Tanacetum coccineum TaxID=301880 RepID=A0ABQ5IWA9_9ASTR
MGAEFSLKNHPSPSLLRGRLGHLLKSFFSTLQPFKKEESSPDHHHHTEMEPDIENMTMNEYLEYEAVKERQLIGAENMKRMGHDIVHDRIWEQDDDSKEDQEEDGDYGEIFYMWDITTEDVERIRKFFNIRDEIDKIVQLLTKILNVAIIDEEADFNPTKDLEELERLLAMRPQSNFMEIQIGKLYILEDAEWFKRLCWAYANATVIPMKLKHAKLILGYRDTCEIRIRLIPC